jgi:uncharacterized repeat protein (TIGR03803 family)
MTNLGVWKKAGVVFVLCAGTAIVAPAQIVSTLATFSGVNNGGYQPVGELTRGRNGSLYGTTYYGGGGVDCSAGCGTVFKINPDGILTTLYRFCPQVSCIDGESPYAGLVLGTDGNLYGTTESGGVYGWGTIFKITSSGTLTTLYSFCGCKDGGSPRSPLILGTDGNFYGTTFFGGAEGAGTVFKITRSGTLITLHSFCARALCSDGNEPLAGLVEGTDGNFYGTTWRGGVNSQGAVFRITPEGKVTTLYSFCSRTSCTDGSFPTAGLVQADDGTFYGTTSLGGRLHTSCPDGCGTIFKVTPDGALTTLYSFCSQNNCPDGAEPSAGLVPATDGNFYGSTPYGGMSGGLECLFGGCGTLFEISLGGTLTTLYEFCAPVSCRNGAEPQGLLQTTDGNFYGTTYYGGNGGGTVFRLEMGLGPFVTFVRFAGRVGHSGPILGQGFTGTTSVSLNGIPASFTVVSDTFIRATVPAGATTGYVTVVTPSGTLTSNVPFHVIQ